MLMLKHRLAFVLTTSMAAATCFAASDQLAVPHVKVTGCTIDTAHTHALAEVLAAARDIYAEWGFNMPKAASLSVTCKDGASADLFNNGNDQLFLTIASSEALAPPAKSGLFSIYGICHELGHIAMYRTLKNRDWMFDAAAEGWADYIGSVVVDRVFAVKGESLWPEAYDYRQDGTARLEKAIASKSASDVTIAAAQWQKLGAIIGLREFPQLFAAWQSAGVGSERPWEDLLPTLEKLQPHNEVALKDWWRGAEPVLVEVSAFDIEQTSSANLSGHAVEVPPGRGSETSRMSIGGTGEGRKFTVPAPGNWYITAVWIDGSRYGEEKAPDTTFDIALGDADAKLISIWKGRYASFAFLQDGWARFDVPPTRLPSTFYVTLNFRAIPAAGVYVAYDSKTKGHSVDSRLGKPPHDFPEGDWMISVEMDRKK